MQDDFASAQEVAPIGDTIKLKIVLPKSYDSSFYDTDAMDLFFESKSSS